MKKLIYIHGQQEDTNVTHIEFPTGEKHIRIRGLNVEDDVVLVYNDPSGDVMKLGMAVDICRRARVRSIQLVMPFVPYARQDRVMVEGDPFSIRVFSEFVNSLHLNRVYITDPHSDVTPACLLHATVVPQHEVAMNAVLELDQYVLEPLALVAPDLGAAKKIKALQSYIKAGPGLDIPVIQCDKTRDVETGKITGFKVLDGDPTGKHCLLVDDICDGGGTFMGLYPALRDAGAVAASLYVTHGIFSKGVHDLLECFDHIYTSDSFPKTAGVHTISLGDYVT